MLLLTAVLSSLTAGATPPHDHAPFEAASRLVQQVYLASEGPKPTALLFGAAQGLAAEVHWLFVAEVPGGVRLDHGDGTALGTVLVGGPDDLPRALTELKQRVAVVGDVASDRELSLSALSGMVGVLDRYSRVLADEHLDRFNVRLSGTLVGIGVGFRHDDANRMLISRVEPGGPAAVAGVQVGDEIVRIDGRSVVNMPIREASRRIRGPAGTPTILSMRRAGRTQLVELHRAEIVVPNVSHAVLADGVGYVKIDHVSQRTVENLRKALDALRREDALLGGLVVDLRGNTGGSMKESARVADLFLEEGLLLRTVGKDGGPVQNLQAEMWASDTGDEPAVPVVLLADDRTASGSEIIAGALVEGGRAALVGSTTYGKGTVQKIYPLGRDVRLKLTVARYILANGRTISDGGLQPDVAMGQVRLDEHGVWFRGEGGVIEVAETAQGRGRLVDGDLARELARRAVSAVSGTGRDELVAALRAHAEVLRAEQDARLTDALAARGVDWSAGPRWDVPPAAAVRVAAHSADSDVVQVDVHVTNTGPEPLHRAMVGLSSNRSAPWDGLSVVVGRVDPGQTVAGSLRLLLPPGLQPRADTVQTVLMADGRPPAQMGTAVLYASSSPAPTVRLTASLGDPTGARGPHGHPVRPVRVVVHNLSRRPLSGAEVHFAAPAGRHVELLDRGARARVVPAEGSVALSLDVELAPTAALVIPLQVVVRSDAHRVLANWPLDLPATGAEVRMQPPSIRLEQVEVARPAGGWRVPIHVRDDQEVDHVVVWVNGRKHAWHRGGAGQVDMESFIRLQEGYNRIVVRTEDNQGLVAHFAVSVLGLPHAATVDATDP